MDKDRYEDNGSTFRPNDISDKRKRHKFKRFKRNYAENRHGKWRDEAVASNEDWQSLVDAFASRLVLTDYQQERARKLAKDLPRKHWRANRSDCVALVVCSIVGKEDGREYHPLEGGENVDIAVDLDISRDELLAVWERARQDMEVDL